jgi:XrtN system VIT domain protein
MKDDGIEPGTFSFSGNAYTMQPYQLVREKVETRSVYLDVNAAWSSREFNDVLKLVAPRPAYVWLNDEMMQVGEDNRDECLKALQARRFSLFPLHRISSPATSLLISKSTPVSPSLADLQGSEFRRDLSEYLSMAGQPKVRLLNIGEELSPYLRSLKEYRVFRYEKGGIFLLKVLLDGGAFAADIESPDTVVIDQANMAIVRQDSLSAGKANTAPDHLMRLFAYNHIMQQTGKGLMTGSAGQDTLVTVAQQAHVVSPLSSLIVLETQKDYDRFNIKDKGNSLKNASMKSTGAVPEPHEWALIILVLLTLVYIKFRPAWSKANV